MCPLVILLYEKQTVNYSIIYINMYTIYYLINQQFVIESVFFYFFSTGIEKGTISLKDDLLLLLVHHCLF